MSGIDIEVARAGLVIGLVLSAMIYHVTRVAAGGTVTGAYLGLLLYSGQWIDIAGWFLLSLLGIFVIRLAARLWPLPRGWLFAIGVAIPASVHTLFLELATFDVLQGFSAFLTAGLYVTNGLTAYDAQRQGIPRTFAAALMVGGLTCAILIPLGYAMALVRDGAIVESAPSLTNPVAVLAGLLIALTVRLTLHWGTAGIVGGLFLIELYSLVSVALIIAFTLVGYGIYRLVAEAVGLTPKQRLYSLLIVGSISSWFGLFWAQWLGIPGAENAHLYGIEPLLVIGLLIGETARYGIPKMLGGMAIVTGATLVVIGLMENLPEWEYWILLFTVMALSIPLVHAAQRVRREWLQALYGGDRFGPEGLPTR